MLGSFGPVPAENRYCRTNSAAQSTCGNSADFIRPHARASKIHSGISSIGNPLSSSRTQRRTTLLHYSPGVPRHVPTLALRARDANGILLLERSFYGCTTRGGRTRRWTIGCRRQRRSRCKWQLSGRIRLSASRHLHPRPIFRGYSCSIISLAGHSSLWRKVPDYENLPLPMGLRFYGVCECDGSLLIPFGDNRLLSVNEAAAPDELRDSPSCAEVDLNLRSLERLFCWNN
jgi:hypothetical protein